MKQHSIKTTLPIALAVLAAALIGCAAVDQGPANRSAPDPLQALPDGLSSFLGGSDPLIADECSREIQLSNGERICVDDIVAAIRNANLLDNDGDGVPNLNDADIDGDGVPNSHDVDIDGDGLFNGIDDDVDGDGVPNELDADVDGDFIRNRWDLDIDGDLVYNPYDRDADGDALDDDLETEEEEDDDGGSDCGDDDADGDDDGCDDDMPEDAGMNSPTTPSTMTPGPMPGEEQAIDAQVASALDVDEDDVTSSRSQLEEVDRNLQPEDYLDSFHRLLIDAMEDNPPVADAAPGTILPVAPESVRMEVPQRFSAVIELAEVEDDLPEVIRNVDALMDAARQLATALENLVGTAVAYGIRDATPDVAESTAISIEMHEFANDNGIDHADVAEIVPSAVTTADVLNGPSDDNDPTPVFRVVAQVTREFQDDGGNPTFAPPRVARVFERLAGLAESPSIESLRESSHNILIAANGDDPLDPLEIVDALDDVGADASDGISEEEAAAAAAHVSTDGNQDD